MGLGFREEAPKGVDPETKPETCRFLSQRIEGATCRDLNLRGNYPEPQAQHPHKRIAVVFTGKAHLSANLRALPYPDPLKDPKMEPSPISGLGPRIQKMDPPKMIPITTLGKLGDYREVPCLGSFRGSGLEALSLTNKRKKHLENQMDKNMAHEITTGTAQG